jgi:hypothetical protein
MAEDPDDGTIKLRWIRIDRKTDVIALTAFMLALIGTLLQIREWSEGPEVEFIPPTGLSCLAINNRMAFP